MKCDWFHGVYHNLNKQIGTNRDQHSVHVNHPFKSQFIVIPFTFYCKENWIKIMIMNYNEPQ